MWKLALFFCILLLNFGLELDAQVLVGADRLFSPEYRPLLKDKQIGLITNHTAITSSGLSTIDRFKQEASKGQFTLRALFAPEHGLTGVRLADMEVFDSRDADGIPIYSLHGKTRRPTPAMLKGIQLLVYDIQDIGSRSYTYISTLFYAMEEAAKAGIPVVVLDRPNPLNGITIDGPMLEDKWRSFVGYINVPYCHGMTIGELAAYFNSEYQVGCQLIIVPMSGWKRNMSFSDTGLRWIPTSPNIPESDSVYYYPTTGILGELQLVNIGVGYTLPFKIVGAPWINASSLANAMNAQKLPGVYFHPFSFCPYFGRFALQECHGILIFVTNPLEFLPVTTQFTLFGILKNLYPTEFEQALKEAKGREEMFNKVNGTADVLKILKENKYVIWKLRSLHEKKREAFIKKRQGYLIPDYQ